MPRPIAFDFPAAAGHPELAPVESLPDVWTRVQRSFAIEPIEQLPLRARLLDMLELLDRGHMLVLAGTIAPTVWLAGCPDVALLAGVLFTYGYVRPAGAHRENRNIVYFTLSGAGRRKLRQGRVWWNRLSLGQRLRVRLFG